MKIPGSTTTSGFDPRPAATAPRAVAAAAPAAGDGDAATQRLDFNAMTRQQLADWVDEQLRSGQMTPDESTPFVGMTMKVEAATGQLVALAGDGERIDFVARARQGLTGALLRHDRAGAEQLQDALVLMLRQHGTAAGIDTRA